MSRPSRHVLSADRQLNSLPSDFIIQIRPAQFDIAEGEASERAATSNGDPRHVDFKTMRGVKPHSRLSWLERHLRNDANAKSERDVSFNEVGVERGRRFCRHVAGARGPSQGRCLIK